MASVKRRAELIRRFSSGKPGPVAALWIQRLRHNVCPICGWPVALGELKNAISRKEYELSHVCQDCQDNVFRAKIDGVSRTIAIAAMSALSGTAALWAMSTDMLTFGF